MTVRAIRPEGAFDLVALGEPMVELNEGEDNRFLKGFGGDTSNVAIAAARMGARVVYLSAVGDDPFGDDLYRLWAGEGVDASQVRRVEGGETGLYIVTHGADGHRFHYRRKGSPAARMTPADLDLRTVASARILHVSGISQAISPTARETVAAAIGAAREAGTRVAYDPNFRPRLWSLDEARPIVAETACQADILLPGLDDARLLTGLDRADDIIDHYLAEGVGVVALTLGSEGCLVATAEGRRRIPALAVEAVDATGAGDAFDGAFLSELLVGETPFRAARFANCAAALAVQGFGAVAPLPYRGEVVAYLAHVPFAD